MELSKGESLRDYSNFPNDGISDKENMFNEQSTELSTFRQNRIFINHMDSYHGKALTKFLLRRGYETQCEGESLQQENTSTEDRDFLYEVIGTLADAESEFNCHNTRIINSNNKEDFLKELLCCAYVIYDITLDDGQICEAEWALQALAHELEANNDDELHYFLLISTLMTWSSTKQLDPLNPNAPLNEFDYKKRIGHPEFKEHRNCEKKFIMIKDNLMLMKKLKTLVLCCGITYGNGEDPLHFLFKLAWHNSPFLPVFNSGNNKIPLLHVDDLIRIVESLFHNWPEDRCYLVATELNVPSQMTIVESISKVLTTGQTKNIELLENSSFKESISPREFDIMTLDVNIEPAFTVDHNIQSNRNFRRDIKATVAEYRLIRNLRPVRIIILGPPISGKTTLALNLAHYYSIPYISVKSLITQNIQELTNAIEKEVGVKHKESTEDNGNEKDEEPRVVVETTKDLNSTPQHELERQLDEIRNNLSVNNGHLSDDLLNKLMRKKLMSSECNNQGYMLDDYPTTSIEAVKLFINDVTSELILTDESSKKSIIIPETVIQLEASDEFLHNRALNLPERVVHDTHYDVESMVKCLREYREKSEATLKFFIENGIHPLIVNIEDESIGMCSSFQTCLETIGEPRNYGPTTGEIVAVRDVVGVEENPVIVSAENELVEFKGNVAREGGMMEWMSGVEEAESLRELSEPLRLYLVKYVFSTLNQGLIHVVQSRPKDPIDSLAAYLFENNPEGKMDEICASLLQGMDGDSSSEEFYEEGSSNNEF